MEESAKQIAEIQTRPYISVIEATILFGISKNTIHRLIKAGKLSAINLGQRLTRVSRVHLEAMFTEVVMPEEPKKEIKKLHYNPSECYTIGEISRKFGISESSVYKHIRKYSIPTRQIGNYVYAPKSDIDNLYRGK